MRTLIHRRESRRNMDIGRHGNVMHAPIWVGVEKHHNSEGTKRNEVQVRTVVMAHRQFRIARERCREKREFRSGQAVASTDPWMPRCAGHLKQ
jgi:hypothetical protein